MRFFGFIALVVGIVWRCDDIIEKRYLPSAFG